MSINLVHREQAIRGEIIRKTRELVSRQEHLFRVSGNNDLTRHLEVRIDAIMVDLQKLRTELRVVMDRQKGPYYTKRLPVPATA